MLFSENINLFNQGARK